jgi:Tol biopolymer transport system component
LSGPYLRIAIISLAMLACGDDPIEPPPPAPITLETEGRLERGGEIRVVATQSSAPATGVTLVADPVGAVEWLADGRARLLATGPVTFRATKEDATGTLAINVVAPPSITFESTQGGARNIWRIALDGADVLQLTDSPSEDASPSSAAGSVYFLSYRVSPAAVFSVPAGGGAAVRVTTGTGAYSEPAISPDGQQLAFLRSVGGVSKLLVSDRTGANARRLTTSGAGVIEVSPAWSPNGQHVAFVSTLSGNADVYAVPVAGGTAAVLGATGAPEVEPSWSPDSRRIVFARGSGGEADLYAVTVADNTVERLTTRTGVDARPAWLPDGRIVFTASEGADRVLHWLDPAAPATLHRIPHTVTIAGRSSPVR